ncbi:hypothetical protein [Nostoc sp.]
MTENLILAAQTLLLRLWIAIAESLICLKQPDMIISIFSQTSSTSL